VKQCVYFYCISIETKASEALCSYSINIPSRETSLNQSASNGLVKKGISFPGCRKNYLGRISIVKMSRGDIKKKKIVKKVNQNSVEIFRQFGKTTSDIRMYMESNIKNYNKASNKVLKKQIEKIKSFEVLPKSIIRARTSSLLK